MSGNNENRDDWARLELEWYATPADQLREAMDYEEAARYDRWDGYGDPDTGADEYEPDEPFIGPIEDATRWLVRTRQVIDAEAEADDNVPF